MAERDEPKNKNPAPDPDKRVKKRGRPPLNQSRRGHPPIHPGILPNILPYVETGTGFVPHQFTVYPGENLIEKVSAYAKRSSATVCVLCALGSISSVVFRKPGPPSTDTVTWEGRFDILSLSGNYTFIPGEEGVYGRNNRWNLSICDCNGAVFGGAVAGPVIVASHVDLILGTFKLKRAQETRRHAVATPSAAVAGPRLMEIDTETLSHKNPTLTSDVTPKPDDHALESVTPKTDKTSESVTPKSDDHASESVTPKSDDYASECLTPKTTDKTSESVTPKTADKTSEGVTTPKTTDQPTENVTSPKTTDQPTESVTSAMRDYSMHWCIDLEKDPGEDQAGEGEKHSGCSPTSRLLTTDKPPESVTPKTTDKPPENFTPSTSDNPPENFTPSTSDNPPENFTPATSDKPSENVSPATTRESPENVVASTSDAIPVLSCCFNKESKDVPMNEQL